MWSFQEAYPWWFVLLFLTAFVVAVAATVCNYSDRFASHSNYFWASVILNLLINTMLALVLFQSQFIRQQLLWDAPWWRVLLDTVVILVVDDAYFYWLHRIMHRTDWLRENVHAVHHEDTPPSPLDYLYSHPIENALAPLSYGIVMLGYRLMRQRVHAASLLIAVAIRLLHEMAVHSSTLEEQVLFLGFIPLFNKPAVHLLHHENFRTRAQFGNYASLFPWWDWVMGTTMTRDA
jgi:sterol desaturase/sphingolipid hydroxylase (fatty acid hydroxylase superfamily)